MPRPHRLRARRRHSRCRRQPGTEHRRYRLFHPDQPIVAFEPHPDLAAKLRSRFEDDQKAVIHNLGLGDDAGEFTLYVPGYNGLDFDGEGALTFGEHQWSHMRENILMFDKAC